MHYGIKVLLPILCLQQQVKFYKTFKILKNLAACSLENGDATVSYWSSTTVDPPVPSIGSYPSVANSNQQAYVFSSNRGTCLTPCFCTFDGSCYSPSNYTDFLVTFIPYCDSSGKI